MTPDRNEAPGSHTIAPREEEIHVSQGRSPNSSGAELRVHRRSGAASASHSADFVNASSQGLLPRGRGARLVPARPWKTLADQGLHGIGIPEAYDGEGGTIIEQMIVAEELSPGRWPA